MHEDMKQLNLSHNDPILVTACLPAGEMCSQVAIYPGCDLEGYALPAAETPAEALHRLENQARSVIQQVALLTGLGTREPVGWEIISETASRAGIELTAERFCEGTNWGWDDCETLLIKSPQGEFSLYNNYPKGLGGLRIDGVSLPFSKENIFQLERALNAIAEVLKRFSLEKEDAL